MKLQIVLISAVISALPLTAQAAPACAQLRIESPAACTDTGAGIAIGESKPDADRLAGIAREGETRFRRFFDDHVPAYAIDARGPNNEAQKDLLKQGFAFVLPWTSGAKLVQAGGAALRDQLDKQLADQGYPASLRAQLVDKAIQKLPEQLDARATGIVPHELGHLWLVRRYWGPDAPIDSGGDYGGPAPDWLDELAAILMEDDKLAAERRDQFKRALAGKDKKLASPWPLAEILNLKHPNAGDADANKQGISISAASPQQKTYYTELRVFADFVLAQSGDPRVFAGIAEGLAGGKSFDQWLATAPPALGTTVHELEEHWTAWLAANGYSST